MNKQIYSQELTGSNNTRLMTSSVLKQQASRLLWAFIASTFAFSVATAQIDGLVPIATAEAGAVVPAAAFYEYTVVPETAPRAGDGYLEFEFAPSALGAEASFSAVLNGQPIAARLVIDEGGFARIGNPENGLYERFKVKLNGREAFSSPRVSVRTRMTTFGFNAPPTALEGTDIPYTGRPLPDVSREKTNGCSNNKLTNRGFENGESNWNTNTGAYVVSAGNNQYIFEGTRAMYLDHANAWTGQYFSMGARREFCFSVYAKNHSSAGTMVVGVKFWNAGGQWLGETTVPVARQSGGGGVQPIRLRRPDAERYDDYGGVRSPGPTHEQRRLGGSILLAG